MFDLAARQICQETIPEAVRGKVNGQWRSIIAFFDMMAYVIATIFPDPSQFYILTSISACMVLSFYNHGVEILCYLYLIAKI